MNPNERAESCPYRLEIHDLCEHKVPALADVVSETNNIVKEMHQRLFVKGNGDPLVVEVEDNTNFRLKYAQEKLDIKRAERRSKWRRRSFYLALISLIITNVIILFKIYGGL